MDSAPASDMMLVAATSYVSTNILFKPLSTDTTWTVTKCLLRLYLSKKTLVLFSSLNYPRRSN